MMLIFPICRRALIHPILIFFILALLKTPTWGSETPLSAGSPLSTSGYAIIGVDVGNIREAPGYTSTIKYRLKKGDTVYLKEKNGEWYLVAIEKEKHGWAHESLLAANTETAKPESSATATPIDQEPTSTSPAEEQDSASEYPIPRMLKWNKENPGRFIFVAEGTFRYSLSDQEGEDTLTGGDIQAVIAPSYQLTDQTYFDFVYNGRYYKRRDFYQVDEGPFERSEFMGNTFTALMRTNFGENGRFSTAPSVFYSQTYNKDITSDDSWEGLYNYRDIGGGLDFTAGNLGFAGGMGTFGLGAQIYSRKYPNYVSLLDLATGVGAEVDNKDYHGVLVRTGYSWLKNLGFSWTANYSGLFKRLDTKLVVDENGLLTGDHQNDQLHTLDLSAWYLFSTGIRVGLGANFGLNDSNQNWYDARGTVALDDDVFIPDYYDYYFYRVSPNVSYTFGMFGLFPFTLSYAFSFQELFYTDRLARFADGNYKQDDQEDELQEHFVGLRYEYNRRLSFILQFQDITNRSNNDDERVYQYNYKIYNYFVGVHLRY